MSQETAQETIHGTNSVPVIQTVNLRKTYMQGGKPLEVLKGLCLTVEPGVEGVQASPRGGAQI